MTRRLLPFLLGVVAAIAFTAPAGAVNIPRAQSKLTSAQIVDGRLIWFQRNDRWKTTKRRGTTVTAGVGALYARTLTAKKAERVYLPPKGQKIVDFKAGAGRIVVGLAKITDDGYGPTEVLELTPGETLPWPAKPIASDPDVIDQATCHSRVELVAIQSDGDVIVQHDRLEGRANCSLLRQVGRLEAHAKDGGVQQLTERKSGWASEQDWSLLPRLQPSDNDWMLQAAVNHNFGVMTPVSTINVTTGETKDVTSDVPSVERVEPLTGGGVVFRVWWSEGALMPSLADPSVSRSLRRAGHETWFHACGSRIIEFARGWRRSNHAKWTIYLRNGDGKTTTKLKTLLPRGTMFDACDQNTAVFHRARHDGGAHQWTVNLAP